MILLPGELRRALLEVRRDPFPGIVALEQELLQFPFDRESFAESGFSARLHCALDAADGATGFVRRTELAGVIENNVEERAAFEVFVAPDFGDQPGGERFV